MDTPVEKQQPPAFLEEELPGDRALRGGAARLHRAVTELPLRYAPFFGRLARMWDVSEEHVLSELRRAKEPKAWRSTVIPGLTLFNLERRGPSAVRARLMRFEPGVHFPKHTHRGSETILVLEGAYADASGVSVSAGETQTMPQGSEHELVILGSEPCVAAIAERGIAFTSPWLRWANWLIR